MISSGFYTPSRSTEDVVSYIRATKGCPLLGGLSDTLYELWSKRDNEGEEDEDLTGEDEAAQDSDADKIF